MNLDLLFSLLDANAAPPRAKLVISGLLTCRGTRKMTPEAFQADPEMQALKELGLVTLEAKGLVVTQKARELVGLTPAV